jgi:hypothetical protein
MRSRVSSLQEEGSLVVKYGPHRYELTSELPLVVDCIPSASWMLLPSVLEVAPTISFRDQIQPQLLLPLAD